MVNSINSLLAQTWFGNSSSTTVGIGADLLTSWAAAKAGVGATVATPGQDPNQPWAPVWTPGVTPNAASLTQRALDGKAFFDTNAQLFTDLGATGDYRSLFALHTGLSTMHALAGAADNDKLTAQQRAALEKQFGRGLTELQAFFAQQQFEGVRVAQGDRVDQAQTTLAIASTSEDYITPVIHKGSLADKVTGLDPNAKFDIVATSFGGTERRVTIDLAEMGSIPRTLGSIVSFMNGKLAAAGASSRIEAVNQTPKTQTIQIGGKPVERAYVGPRQYALKVDVRSNESVAFEAANTKPAFYMLGGTTGGARLVKLEDVGGAAGQPVLLDRPGATNDPIGAHVASGWYGVGAPYTTAPVAAFEKRTNALMSDGTNSYEDRLRAAGDAVLKLDLGDGRTVSVSTAWRSDDLEAWRQRSGESDDRAILDDLAERFTQLLHEQGVAAAVDVWEEDGALGFSVFAADQISVSSFAISGRQTLLTDGPDPVGGMVGGLRAGVFARRFEADAVIGASDLFVGEQSFTFTTSSTTSSITIDGGEDGIDAAELVEQLNEKLREKGFKAAVSPVDEGGTLTLRFDALHDMLAIKAEINETDHDVVLQAPGAWANGGLPVAGAGEPYGDAIRTFSASGGSPLLTHTGALDISIVIDTPTGAKTVSVEVTAQERLDNPDIGAGEWNAVFKARLDAALNAAGVYVSANGDDLTSWSVAEGAGQRIASVTINGDALDLEAQAPGYGLGGAFSAQRSFTSAQAATGVSDVVADLVTDPTVSITIATAWGPKTISATLDVGDPRTLESAALRLNEALAAQGYDVGVAATALSDGGAGLRIVTGESNTVRGLTSLSIGGSGVSATLDPIDAQSYGDDPIGAARVADRASRGAAITEVVSATSPFAAPSAAASNWFAGRAFDVNIGGAHKVAAARSVATGPNGSVYVLADLSGDTSTTAIKGQRDVALLKFDSAGKLVQSRMLGASESASGFALAVSADGKVAVAGSVTGALSNTGAPRGGTDSFVTVFDTDGDELWTARRGATADDEARSIAFAPDGSVIIAGKTDGSMAGSFGGADGYVRGYSASGLELFTKQFGTSGADGATALVVRDNGAGGVDILTGGVENYRGVVRSFSYASNTGLVTGATRDIGYFHGGAINTMSVDGGNLYVGGEIGADRLTVGDAARGAVAGKEGFVARMSINLASTAFDRTTYIGSAQDDAVTGIAVVNGEVYASGSSGGLLAGSGTSGGKTSFLTRLGADGDIDWTRTFPGASGAFTPTALAVDTSGASALDVLGLPRGKIAAADSAALVNRSALRAGDELKIGLDGRRAQTITVGANDTLAMLATRINRVIGSGGYAKVVKENGAERLTIVAAAGHAVRVEAGRAGKDALGALGLKEGVVSKNSDARGALRSFGLGLVNGDLKLTDKATILSTKAEISAALSIVKQAYEALANPNAKPMTDEERALEARRNTGAVPEYYTQRLANYQAALSRLGG